MANLRIVDAGEQLSAEGTTPETTVAVLAQAWRDPSTQVPLRRLSKATRVHEFGDSATVAQRCAVAGTCDVVDASLAVLADQLGRTILTTDPTDMEQLGAHYAEL